MKIAKDGNVQFHRCANRCDRVKTTIRAVPTRFTTLCWGFTEQWPFQVSNDSQNAAKMVERTGTNEYSYLLCATGFSRYRGYTIGGISPSGYKHITPSREGNAARKLCPRSSMHLSKGLDFLRPNWNYTRGYGITAKYLIYNSEWIIHRLNDKSVRYLHLHVHLPL